MVKIQPIPIKRKDEDIAYDFLKSFIYSGCCCVFICISIFFIFYNIKDENNGSNTE